MNISCSGGPSIPFASIICAPGTISDGASGIATRFELAPPARLLSPPTSTLAAASNVTLSTFGDLTIFVSGSALLAGRSVGSCWALAPIPSSSFRLRLFSRLLES